MTKIHTRRYGNDVYQGELKMGEPHGEGIKRYHNGDVYEGQFFNGRPHGEGVKRYSAGDVYTGGFKVGRLHDEGTMVYSTGEKYTGAWKQGRHHGHGIIIMEDGSEYEGEFSCGLRDGEGTLVFKNGHTWIGEWRCGMPHGKGTNKITEGTYEGTVSNALRHGIGLMTYSNGDTYKGNWVNNSKDGHGTETLNTGESYDGNWRNNFRHGKGMMIDVDGMKHEGLWVNGVMQSQSMCQSCMDVASQQYKEELLCLEKKYKTLEISYEELKAGGNPDSVTESIRQRLELKYNIKNDELKSKLDSSRMEGARTERRNLELTRQLDSAKIKLKHWSRMEECLKKLPHKADPQIYWECGQIINMTMNYLIPLMATLAASKPSLETDVIKDLHARLVTARPAVDTLWSRTKMMLTSDPTTVKIDLHAQNLRDAEACLEDELTNAQASCNLLGKKQVLQIVTGQGIHSYNNKAVIKDMAIRKLEDHRIPAKGSSAGQSAELKYEIPQFNLGMILVGTYVPNYTKKLTEGAEACVADLIALSSKSSNNKDTDENSEGMLLENSIGERDDSTRSCQSSGCDEIEKRSEHEKN